MTNFIFNNVYAVWAFIGWYLAGLGPSIILTSGHQRREAAFLIAPLLGMSLLTLIGLFQISVLLIPLSPWLNLSVLVLISLLLCFWSLRRETVSLSFGHLPNTFVLFIPSLLLLFSFAWLFHREGFQLLVGGSDQLQYCVNAKQILEMHTGSPADLPIARYDHILHDIVARYEVYYQYCRRGAEVILATTKVLTGQSVQEAFPVVILCILMTLGLTVGYIGRIFLHFSKVSCLMLQFTLLSSFYLFLLHLQGSLALLMAMAPSLATLALLSQLMFLPTWRELILTAIFLATYFATYPESGSVNMVVSLGFLLLWQARVSLPKFFLAVRNIFILFILVFIFAPFAFFTVIAQLMFIFHLFHSIFGHAHSQTVASSLIAQLGSLGILFQPWTLASVVLGLASYYDGGYSASKIVGFITTTPWASLLVFFSVCGLGLLGFFKMKTPLARLFAILIGIWLVASIMMTFQQDGLRFARSLHYAMPYAMFGLVILASQETWSTPSKKSIFWVSATWLGRLTLMGFILMNVRTDIRSINYLASHNVNNDSIVLRFDERAAEWQNLQAELASSASQGTPVLISGFRETVRPLAIASALPFQPHVVGTSILSFWPVYNMQFDDQLYGFNTRLSVRELAKLQKKYHWSSHPEVHLIGRSMQAVVPVGHTFPMEWSNSKDIYTPLIKHFPNICDVVYRKEFAVDLQKQMTLGLLQDKKGPFRLLLKSGPIFIHQSKNTLQQLILIYDGEPGEVRLKIRDHLYDGTVLEGHKQVRISAQVLPQEAADLNLLVKRRVKLRSITWQ